MIITALLSLFTLIISTITLLLPSWDIFPPDLYNGLTYFFSSLAKMNFIFPVDTLFTVLLFIVNFEVIYFTAKIIMKIVNYIRGTGSGLDI